MRWLITVDASAETELIKAELARIDAEFDASIDPVPLPPDEITIFVDGPRDLATRLRESDSTPHLLACYPDSEQTLYEDGMAAPDDGDHSTPDEIGLAATGVDDVVLDDDWYSE